MPIQLNEENGGKILIARVSGKLLRADYETFVPAFERQVRQHGRLGVLFEMIEFHGWDVPAAWEDLKFGVAHLGDIERLALVGETLWQHNLVTFFKPFMRAPIRYFDRADFAKARVWLEHGDAPARPAATGQANRDN